MTDPVIERVADVATVLTVAVIMGLIIGGALLRGIGRAVDHIHDRLDRIEKKLEGK